MKAPNAPAEINAQLGNFARSTQQHQPNFPEHLVNYAKESAKYDNEVENIPAVFPIVLAQSDDL